jgi:acyl-CoA thioesterase II
VESLTSLRGDPATGQFSFEARPELCVPDMFLFGGATASAVAEAIEVTANQPLAWFTTQFQQRILPGATVHLHVARDVERRRLTQCRVEGTVEGETVFRALGATAARESSARAWGPPMPDVPAPAESPPLNFREGWMESGFPSRFEWRTASGRLFADSQQAKNQDGRACVWVRWPGHELGSAPGQAYLSDLGMTTSDSASKGQGRGGVSLDNTLRIVSIQPTEWLLLECSLRADTGLAHVEISIWSESGDLMGLHTTTALNVRT